MNFFSKLSNPKILLPLFGVFVVLVLGGAYYYYQVYLPSGGQPIIGDVTPPPPPGTPPPSITPETDPTAGWPTYTHPTDRFSYKYLSGWYPGVSLANYNLNYGPPEGSSPRDNLKIDFLFAPNGDGKTLAEYFASDPLPPTVLSESTITVSGYSGVLREERSTWGVEVITAYLQVGSRIFIVSGLPRDSLLIDKYHLILNTLQFNQ